MKRLVKGLTMAVSGLIAINVHAVTSGMYLGLLTGPASNTAGTQNVQLQGSTATVPANPKTKQWGASAFLGYQMNRYAAVEGGFHYFSSINYTTTPSNAPVCSGPVARVRDIYIAGKGILPLGDFSLFAKGGAGVVYRMLSGSLSENGQNGQCGTTTYTNKVSPIFAVGAAYDLSQSWVADVSWTRVMVGGVSGNMDLIGVGISYHFTNRYCGQFLCDD